MLKKHGVNSVFDLNHLVTVSIVLSNEKVLPHHEWWCFCIQTMTSTLVTSVISVSRAIT